MVYFVDTMTYCWLGLASLLFLFGAGLDHELRIIRSIYSHKLKGETEFTFVLPTFMVPFE